MKKLLLAIFLVLVAAAPAVAITEEYYVSDTVNDGGWWTSTAFTDGGTTIPAFGGAATTGGVYLRFTDIMIPGDATITDCHLHIEAAENETIDPSPDTIIYLWDGDDAVSPTSRAEAVTMFGQVTTGTTWDTPTEIVLNDEYATANFASDLQTVIDRAGWAVGEPILIMMDPSGTSIRNADNFGQSSGQPILHVTWTAAGGWTRTYDRYLVAADASDGGAAYNPNCATFSTTTDLYFGALKKSYAEFDNVGVPAGATVDMAYVTWTCDTSPCPSGTDATLYGWDGDDATAPTTCGEFDTVLAAKTTASTAVSLSANAALHSRIPLSGDGQAVTSIIQEIVDRAGWAAGQDMMLLIEAGTATAKALNGYNAATAANHTLYLRSELIVFWTVPGYPHEIGDTAGAGIGQLGDTSIESISKVGGTE